MGLHCAVANSVPLSLTNGFNDPAYHDALQKEYSELIPVLADLGIQNLICFSGNRRGIGDEQGIEQCAIGLDPIVALAQKYGITLVMELLNPKVDHKVAFPLIAGAGTITTLLSIRAEFYVENIIVAIIVNIIFVYFVLKSSRRIESVLGKNGLSVIRKVFGVILLAIAVKLFAANINVLFNA